MNPEFIPPMIYEFIIWITSFSIVLRLVKRYKENPNRVLKYMVLCLLFFTFAIGITAFSRILRVTGLWNLPNGKTLELLAFNPAFIDIANIFFFMFTLEVFADGALNEKNKKWSIIYAILNSTIAVYAVARGLFIVDLPLDVWITVIVTSLAIYIYMIRQALKVAKSLEDSLKKRSTQFLGLGGISISMVFIFSTLDVLVGGNFSPFYYVAWAFVVVSVIIFYTALLRPKWFVERYEKSIENRSSNETNKIE